MSREELVHEETREGFLVRLYFGEEDMAPDWDMTDDERTELFRKIDAGLLLWFYAHVVAERDGMRGEDYLGGCCYKSAQDFMQPGGYYSDMVNEAINSAREQERRAALARCFIG